MNFPMGFGFWEGLQSIGNGCGLQMDGFSAHFDQYESISVDFHDFGHFGVVPGRLTLFPEGPWTLREDGLPSIYSRCMCIVAHEDRYMGTSILIR